MYEAANGALDIVIDKTITQLTAYRQRHNDDDQDDGFITGLVRSFVDQAARSAHGAGAITMGLAAYRMAIQQLEIDRLEAENQELQDAIEMRDTGLQLLWALSDDAEQSGD